MIFVEEDGTGNLNESLRSALSPNSSLLASANDHQVHSENDFFATSPALAIKNGL